MALALLEQSSSIVGTLGKHRQEQLSSSPHRLGTTWNVKGHLSLELPLGTQERQVQFTEAFGPQQAWRRSDPQERSHAANSSPATTAQTSRSLCARTDSKATANLATFPSWGHPSFISLSSSQRVSSIDNFVILYFNKFNTRVLH